MSLRHCSSFKLRSQSIPANFAVIGCVGEGVIFMCHLITSSFRGVKLKRLTGLLSADTLKEKAGFRVEGKLRVKL